MKTKENPFGVPRFAVCNRMKIESSKNCAIEIIEKDKYVANKMTFRAKENETVRIIKYISVVTSRDYKEEELAHKSLKLIGQAEKKGFSSLKKSKWKHGKDVGKRQTLKLRAIRLTNREFVLIFSNVFNLLRGGSQIKYWP